MRRAHPQHLRGRRRDPGGRHRARAPGGAQLSARLLRLLLTALGLGIVIAAPASAAEVCGLPAANAGPQDQALRDFARRHRIEYVEAFVAVVDTIGRTGRLPDCYLGKRAAEARHWREGADLWQVAPGAAIGGDRYGNREGRLPPAYDGRYREADLDYAGGHRGGHRLIFVEESAGRWLLWVTTDHYRHLARVPPPE